MLVERTLFLQSSHIMLQNQLVAYVIPFEISDLALLHLGTVSQHAKLQEKNNYQTPHRQSLQSVNMLSLQIAMKRFRRRFQKPSRAPASAVK